MSTDRTQGFFHRYANDFDAIYSNRAGLLNGFLNGVFRKSMKLRYLKTIEGCQPIQGKTALDVGCGPGHYAITLAQRGAAGDHRQEGEGKRGEAAGHQLNLRPAGADAGRQLGVQVPPSCVQADCSAVVEVPASVA